MTEEQPEEHKEVVPLFRDPAIAPSLRYGLPVVLLITLGLYLGADIGSGVAAVTRIIPDPRDTFSQPEDETLLTVSVFTSVSELWKTGSYALAILIVLTSIVWPYVKLLGALYAWFFCVRERFLVFFDALGKWSFVDVIVFLQIVVVFRSTIPLGGPFLEVWMVPKWGLYAFICASMMNLLGTHVILYQWRRLRLEHPPSEVKGLQISSATRWGASLSTLIGGVLYFSGWFISVYRILNSRAGTDLPAESYALVDIGTDLPDAAKDTVEGGLRYLQIVWFVLGLVMPLLSTLSTLALLWAPLSVEVLRKVFFATEIFFAWSCSEVLFVSTVFAVLEIPKFGDGLIDSGCETCYVVDSELLVEIVVLGLGTVFSTVGTVVAFVRARSSLYT